MPKITPEKLMEKMAHPDLSPEDLAEYFVVDEEGSSAFAPRFKLNPDTVKLSDSAEGTARAAQALNGANWFVRNHRQGLYYRKIRGGYTGPRVVSEGDSWWLYPLLLKDTIDHLMDEYAVFSLGGAGDLLSKMADDQDYLGALERTGADILLLSGGGNDLLARGALASHLEAFRPDFGPEDYLKPSFQALLDSALTQYARIFRQVQSRFPHVSVLCHGYDYPIPQNGRWLGKPMASRNIHDPTLQKGIAAVMMDMFNRNLRRLCESLPNATYIDCRTVVRDDRWHDELHPTSAGYGDVAARFSTKIREISNDRRERSAPPMAISGPFGTAASLSRAAFPKPAVAGGTARGLSLHVGLNSVDPAHYSGWDGALRACEADALDMQSLAEAEGYETKLLLTREATRKAVIAGVEEAAEALKPGDIFLMTVSAHGGRLPDFNRDEDHDDPTKPMDETLCLFDFQLADDELYMLWTKFRAGVRVLMIPDTCHSGSMVKAGPVLPSSLFGRPVAPLPGSGALPRAMPFGVADATWRQNEAAYRDASKSYAALRESVMTAPLSSPIEADVLNLGACQDEQQAMDGAQNGAFTGALLRVWNSGTFAGDYTAFCENIVAEVNDPDQIPTLYTPLVRNPEFLEQKPFAIRPGGKAVTTGAPVAPAGPAYVADDEGDEDDSISDAEVKEIYRAKSGGARSRSASPHSGWADYADFDAFIRGLGLTHFSTDEFLVLGGSHGNPSSPCHNKNTYPPRTLWPNIGATARALDHLRARLGNPVAITNAYRAPAYNACIGGATASQHKRFTALDFKVSGMAAPKVATALRWLRDREGLFVGGIGRYNSFTHIDTRGTNATWPTAFRNTALPASSPLPRAAAPATPTDRRQMIEGMELAAPRGKAPRSRSAPAFAAAVPRDAAEFDPNSELTLHQQTLKAAVNASSVVSFVDNLTPGQKEDVLLSTLFAQRAADAKHNPITERQAWYDRYSEVLSVLGWVRESAPFESSQRMRSNGSFDQVVLTTLATVATGNQMAIVKSAIEALRSLSDSQNQIKLFDFETKRQEGGNFQIGSAESVGDAVHMALGAFNFAFEDAKKNILFVSWGQNNLDYWLSVQELTLSATIYADVRDLVQRKLADTRRTAIADIDLG